MILGAVGSESEVSTKRAASFGLARRGAGRGAAAVAGAAAGVADAGVIAGGVATAALGTGASAFTVAAAAVTSGSRTAIASARAQRCNGGEGGTLERMRSMRAGILERAADITTRLAAGRPARSSSKSA